jgi:hypothetical protein
MDVEYCVIKENDVVTMTNTKMKDFDPPKPLSFKIEKLEQSVVLEPTEFIKKPTVKKLSANASKALTTLNKVIEASGIDAPQEIRELYPDSPQNISDKVVTIEQWRELAYKAITVDSEPDKKQHALKTAFQRCRNDLEKIGSIGLHGDYIWRISTATNLPL